MTSLFLNSAYLADLVHVRTARVKSRPSPNLNLLSFSRSSTDGELRFLQRNFHRFRCVSES